MLSNVHFLAIQELAFRGDGDECNSICNVMRLHVLCLLTEDDPKLLDWMKHKTNKVHFQCQSKWDNEGGGFARPERNFSVYSEYNIHYYHGQWNNRFVKHRAGTVPLRCNLTRECERLTSLAITHATIICARAQVHASGALPTRKSKLTSVLEANLAYVLVSIRKRTRKYSQTNSSVPTNELVSTCKRTCEYSQTNSRVLTNELAGIRKWTREYLQKKRDYLQSNSQWCRYFGSNFRWYLRISYCKVWSKCGMAVGVQ